jgi:hypothetical protein
MVCRVLRGALADTQHRRVIMWYDLGAAFIFQPAWGDAAMGGGSSCGAMQERAGTARRRTGGGLQDM